MLALMGRWPRHVRLAELLFVNYFFISVYLSGRDDVDDDFVV
jgi:hypothetical protein